MISTVRVPARRVLRLALSITAFAGGAFAYAGAAQAQALPTLNPQQYAAALIGAPVAWQRGYTGQGITVAVADSGIDTTHPTFAGKIDPRSRNYVLPAAGAAYDPLQVSDPDGHGTHVAGIIAGSGTAGAPGIAFNAGLVALRAVPSCPTCSYHRKQADAPSNPKIDPFAFAARIADPGQRAAARLTMKIAYEVPSIAAEAVIALGHPLRDAYEVFHKVAYEMGVFVGEQLGNPEGEPFASHFNRTVWIPEACTQVNWKRQAEDFGESFEPPRLDKWMGEKPKS